jgi:hypothetical protein
VRSLRSRLTFSNVASGLALFIALSTGGAYAANTIGSSDVIDNSLLSQDIKDGNVKGVDLANGSVSSGRIIDGSVANADLAADSVTSADVAGNTLTGSDVKESSLDLGGFFAAASGAGACTGDSGVPTECGKATITLEHSGRVLVNATGQWNTFHLDDITGTGADTDDPTLVRGDCGLVVDGSAIGQVQSMGEHEQAGVQESHPGLAPGTMALTAVSGVLAAGPHTVQALCTEADGDLDWSIVNVTAARVDDGSAAAGAAHGAPVPAGARDVPDPGKG